MVRAKEPNLNPRRFDGIRKSITMYDRSEIEWDSKFARFGCIDPYNTLINAKEYIFFTRPDLNIFNASDDSALNEYTASIPYFRELFSNYKHVLRHLQASNSVSKSEGPFMNMLSWAVKNTLDLPSVSAEAVSTSANIDGTEIQYMNNYSAADGKFEFTLDFEDTKFFDIYNIFDAWVRYAYYKSKGIIPPLRKYILNQELYDLSSVYKFIVDQDSQDIIYYAKIWGVFPVSVPRETIANLAASDDRSFTVSFNGVFVDGTTDPLIINDFNTLVAPYCKGKKDIPIYDKENNRVNGELVNIPYIKKYHSELSGYDRYKLMWR